MINWNSYRDMFPVTREHVYFMTAGAGPIPTPVLESIQQRYEMLALHGGHIFGENLEQVEKCRHEIAKLINADVEEIAFVPNVSFGMNAVALSLPGKMKFTVPQEEFSSSYVPFVNAGHKVDFVESDPDIEGNLIEAANNDNASIITSFVQYSSGYRCDITALKSNLKNKKAMLIVNATQGIGVFPIDVKKNQVDVLIAACHKWMFCGEGIAFMYIKKELCDTLKPAIIGWRSSPFAMQFNAEFSLYKNARVFEIGWSNMTIFYGLRKSLEIVNQIGVPNIGNRVTNLSAKLVDELEKANMPIISKRTAHHRSGIVLIGPFENSDDIVEKLSQRNILVTKRGIGIRISLHIYNNEQDIKNLMLALKQVVK